MISDRSTERFRVQMQPYHASLNVTGTTSSENDFSMLRHAVPVARAGVTETLSACRELFLRPPRKTPFLSAQCWWCVTQYIPCMCRVRERCLHVFALPCIYLFFPHLMHLIFVLTFHCLRSLCIPSLMACILPCLASGFPPHLMHTSFVFTTRSKVCQIALR